MPENCTTKFCGTIIAIGGESPGVVVCDECLKANDRDARNAGLERAAEECEASKAKNGRYHAARIRALKEQP